VSEVRSVLRAWDFCMYHTHITGVMENRLAIPNGTVVRVVKKSNIVPTLQNVVATVNLGCKLNLKDIALMVK
jgi:hypothetical protein